MTKGFGWVKKHLRQGRQVNRLLGSYSLNNVYKNITSTRTNLMLQDIKVFSNKNPRMKVLCQVFLKIKPIYRVMFYMHSKFEMLRRKIVTQGRLSHLIKC